MCEDVVATEPLEIDGVDSELCGPCAYALDHPSPETIVRELARMSESWRETAEAVERM